MVSILGTKFGDYGKSEIAKGDYLGTKRLLKQKNFPYIMCNRFNEIVVNYKLS